MAIHWKALRRAACLIAACAIALTAQPSEDAAYQRRVREVQSVPGLVAFWDFVLREAEAPHRFLAHAASGPPAFPLDAENYVRSYWQEGRPATYADFPLLGRGPFGQAVQFHQEAESNFRPVLLAPRRAIHDTGLDVKGPGASVSMAVWMIRQGGNHAIAGIWHEGTDLVVQGKRAANVQAGRRQYALFAGLAANDGAAAVHVSENGGPSFGDIYARNLATTRRRIPTVPPDAAGKQLDAAWSVVGFVFDNRNNTVTAYLDGEAEDYWIEEPRKHPFFRWPANAWLQAKLHRMPGLQEGEDPVFPQDQFYEPPEGNARRRRLSASGSERVWELTYEFTKVQLTERRTPQGKWLPSEWKLLSLRVNPFWFAHDLYTPKTKEDGGPFTIGRVIHSGWNNSTQQWIGGVAVFNRALKPQEMRHLANIGRTGKPQESQIQPIAKPVD
ncbi:MAG: hypothetical protein IT169_03635 [Bryobacterales bacterium]|nr:hypothetical protein [Bryobacterales bacterium]